MSLIDYDIKHNDNGENFEISAYFSEKNIHIKYTICYNLPGIFIKYFSFTHNEYRTFYKFLKRILILELKNQRIYNTYYIYINKNLADYQLPNIKKELNTKSTINNKYYKINLYKFFSLIEDDFIDINLNNNNIKIPKIPYYPPVIFKCDFIKGIYILVMLLCFNEKNMKTIETKDFKKSIIDCIKQKQNTRLDEYKISFLSETEYNFLLNKPRSELIDKAVNYALLCAFTDKEKSFLNEFLRQGWFEEEVDWYSMLSLLFDELFTVGIKVEHLKHISYKTLDNLVDIEKFKLLYNKYEYKDDIIYKKFKNSVKDFDYKIQYGMNGCVKLNKNNKSVIYNVNTHWEILKKSPKMEEDFFVFRKLNESTTYNPSDKISKIFTGNVEEHYSSFISTTFDYNFALSWGGKTYCCLYIIHVNKNNDYIVLDVEDNTQKEILLAPGVIKLTNVYVMTGLKGKEIICFYGEYQTKSSNEINWC